MTASPTVTAEPAAQPHTAPRPRTASLVLLTGGDRDPAMRLNAWMQVAHMGPSTFRALSTATSLLRATPGEVWVAKVLNSQWRGVVAQLPHCGWLDPTEVFLWVKPQGDFAGDFPRVYRADFGQPETWLIPPLTPPSEALA